MRKDMHKVIVEEPRHGGGRDKKNRRANLPDELLPKHEGIRRPYTNRKRFGEHLGPLKRWLRSNCGRPWNEVYSEAAFVMKATDPVRLHIKFHMMQMIERNTFAQDGQIFCYSRSGPVKIADLGGHPIWPTFYVHPESGLLMELPWRRRKGRHRMEVDDQRWLGHYRVLKRLDGLWFECELLPFPERLKKGESPLRYDMAQRQFIGPSQGREIYRKRTFCVRKRQLSKKELKAHGLSNSGGEITVTTKNHRIQQCLAFELPLSSVIGVFQIEVALNSASRVFFALRPVGRVAQVAVRKTAEVGAIPTRDSLNDEVGMKNAE